MSPESECGPNILNITEKGRLKRMSSIIKLEESREIYIYGYSNLGRNVFNKLKLVFPDKIKGIVVTEHNRRTRRSGRADIFELQELAETIDRDTTTFVISTESSFHKDIEAYLDIEGYLRSNGYKSVRYTREMDDLLDNRIAEAPQIETRFLSVSVGQACNYSCRDCTNFAPYARPENKRYDAGNIIEDIDRLLPCFGIIDTFHIQGGEPFLYTDLEKVVCHVKDKYDSIIREIQIATNGTILPSDKVISVLKNCDVEVRISDYKKEVKKELIQALERENISYYIYKFAGGQGMWKQLGGLRYVDRQNDPAQKIRHCMWKDCYMIENGKVGRCARSVPAITLQNISYKKDDYIDLKHEPDKKKVWRYFSFISPMTCCNHCMGSFGEDVEPAIQME